MLFRDRTNIIQVKMRLEYSELIWNFIEFINYFKMTPSGGLYSRTKRIREDLHE